MPPSPGTHCSRAAARAAGTLPPPPAAAMGSGRVLVAGAVLVALVALGARLAAGTRPSGELGVPVWGWCRVVPPGVSRRPPQPRAQRSELRGSGFRRQRLRSRRGRGGAGTERGRGVAFGSAEGQLGSLTVPPPRSIFPVECYN